MRANWRLVLGSALPVLVLLGVVLLFLAGPIL